MSIGNLLRETRKNKGYTLKELSVKSGVSLSFISDIENGRRTPSAEKAKKLAEALEIDVTMLLDEDVAAMIKEVKKDAEGISDPNIRAIARAGKNLTPEQTAELKKFAERLFPDAFKEK